MTLVYLLEGWMGSLEWVEGVYADEAHAQAVADELWKTRASEHAPEWTHGFCKFAVEPHLVIEAAASPAHPTAKERA